MSIMDTLRQALFFATVNTLAYALIVYGNISLLFPRLYQKKKTAWYFLASILFLVAVGLIRTWIYMVIYPAWTQTKQEPLPKGEAIYITLAGFLIFFLSFIFRIAIDWFQLKRQAQKILEQKSIAELNLLKSQVQPHFLFNTLNNIYYEAYREAPRTALLIGRLSDIMRYFVEESPREKVTLSTEIQFLENYIALEKIRIRYGVKVTFAKEYNGDHTIPPMLLMPFVENIFKHGIDRSGQENTIFLSLREEAGYLLFLTENSLTDTPAPATKESSGLKNLEKRLTLLYGNNFELSTGRSDHAFNTRLKIPLI
jgi:LytS/YehU family sensor histidine kinase